MNVKLSPYEKCLNHLTHNHKLKDDKIITEALNDLLNQRDLARKQVIDLTEGYESLEAAKKDVLEWIKVAGEQERVIDELQKQIEYLSTGAKSDQAEIEDLEKERRKYREALITIEHLVESHFTNAEIQRVLDAALRLPDGPTVDDEADANGY